MNESQDSSRYSYVVVRGRDVVCRSDGSIRLSAEDVLRLRHDEAAEIELHPLFAERPDSTENNDNAVHFVTWSDPNRELPPGFEARNLRSFFGDIPEEEFWLTGRGYQLAHWDRTHRYCGNCGNATELADREIARRCTQCGHTSYPRISPAIITAVVRDGTLLLAHNAQRSLPFYSVVAGFVEPGETLEECVVREVLEETGIRVHNVKYMASQPWPFPDSLMLAFTAEYQSGEIQVDGEEIDHAYWCTPDNLPQIPSRPSVARRLIDWFVETNRSPQTNG